MASAANGEVRAALYRSDSPITSSDVRWERGLFLNAFDHFRELNALPRGLLVGRAWLRSSSAKRRSRRT